jgi:hypothetical protein
VNHQITVIAFASNEASRIRYFLLWHFSSYDTSALLSSLNRYSGIAASRTVEQRDRRGAVHSKSPELAKRIVKNLAGWFRASHQLTGARLVLAPGLGFLWHYLCRGGFRSGEVGLLTSLSMAAFHLLVEMKIWELEHGVSIEKINDYYDELKLKLVEGTVPDLRVRPFNAVMDGRPNRLNGKK